MKALLLHCKNYRVAITKLATRPVAIAPEAVTTEEQTEKDCLVALVTVEKADGPAQANLLVADIKTALDEIGVSTVALLPFADLSNDLATSSNAIKVLNEIETKLKDGRKVLRGHFGSHKELLLDLYGHPGNARFRSY